MVAAVITASPLLTSGLVWGQQGWQPSRISAGSQARPLVAESRGTSATQATSRSEPAGAAVEQLGSGVALRWKSPAPRQQLAAPASQWTAQHAFSSSPAVAAFGTPPAQDVGAAARQAAAPSTAAPSVALAGAANPLRSTTSVRAVNYQQEPENVFQDPFGDAPPALPNQPSPQEIAPPLPGSSAPPSDAAPDFPDPLAEPELAPDPGALQPPGIAPNPFERELDPAAPAPAPAAQEPRPQDPSPLDRIAPPGFAEPQPPETDDSAGQRDELTAPQRRLRGANLISCEDQRNRVKNLPLSNIDLDVSPSYGEGLRSVKKDTEQQRLDFAAAAEVREWRDYRGRIVAAGRLIDLRDDRVVLDVNGAEQTIPVYSLSDVDVAYLGQAWNLPTQCGTGYEPFEGRNFIASRVQWTASGLCHKPLYFEQVQLERYGHTAGPVLQPLVSTVHFFGNIGVLPYKMGIHPPHECQYALGYYRPGNCAPYMLQPIPWSLRGAITQAAVVTGGAALIP